MADFEATGDELHALVRLGRKRPMPFAFCPSSGDEDSLFATHRKKPPEMIAKAARKASGQTKVCYGTFTVEDRLMTLVLVKELPTIAKKLKKHLRQERLPLDVRVVDMMGNELEADIEALAEGLLPEAELPDLFETEAEDDLPEEIETEDSAEADIEADEDLPDPKSLARQLKDLQPAIMALEGAAGNTLRTALGGAVGLLRAGQLIRAESTVNAIARAVMRQSAVPAPDAAKQDIVARMVAMRPKIGQIGGAAGEKLTAALGIAAQQIAAGDYTKAVKTIDAVDQAQSQMAQSQLAQAGSGPPLTDAAKWDTLSARLEPMVLAAIQAGKGDTDAVKRSFSDMKDKAASGNPAAALAQAPQLVALIKAAQAASASTAEPAAPADVAPIAKVRLAWIDTRNLLRGEMSKLKAAMDTALTAADGMQGALAETSRLFDYLAPLDNRLETTLDALLSAPDGPDRTALKAKARQIVTEYAYELDSDFFRDVDGDNGYAQVKLRAPAMAALGAVSTALAA